MISNTDPAKIDLFAVEGDALDMTIYINYELIGEGRKFYARGNFEPYDGIPYVLATLHLQVRRKDGLLIKDWISGVSPADIIITGGHFTLTDEGFLESGVFDYDLSDGDFTIMRGEWFVKKQITI